MSTCLNLPSLSCSLSSEDIPHTLTLALLQVTLTSYRTLSSYPLLLNLPLLFSPSVSPRLTKGICQLLRGSFSPSPFIPFPLSLCSIFPLSQQKAAAAQFGKPFAFFPALPPWLHLFSPLTSFPSVSSVLFHPPLSQSLSLIPSVPSH